jgi:hypothetical protein
MSAIDTRWFWWAPIALALGLGCTAINDGDEFVIEPSAEVLEVQPDCRRAGMTGRCAGDVPQRCSPAGVWEDAGEACELGCLDGVCYECRPGSAECGPGEGADGARRRRQCTDAGRWMNAEPCGLDTPFCIAGSCIACLPGQRTCIDDIPQSCDADGRWRAEAACPDGQSCVFETGECKACALGEVRNCRGAVGNCAAGVVTCQPDGSWSPCSVMPAEDACEPPGDDGNCDGIPNSPAMLCAVTCAADVACGPPADVGICRRGVSTCSDGALGLCQGAVWPQARDCRSRDDNDCNGTADYLDDTCACDASDTTPKPCPSSRYGDEGICESQMRRCLVSAGLTTSYWGECQGGVGPQPRDCGSHDDNDCDGTPDDVSPSCECRAGMSRPCSAGGCAGLSRCMASASGGATFWGECELPSAWVFAEPERITGLDVAGDQWGPALFPGGGRLLFSAGAPERIYVAERSGETAFGPAELLAGIGQGMSDGTPFVTASGLSLYFDSRRRSGTGRDIWRAVATAGGWGSAELVPSVNSNANDQNPWVSPDERLLVFNSDRGGNIDLWASVWSEGGLGAPFRLAALNSDASDEGATLTRDGLTVFFASNRPGGNGGLDIWVAARTSQDAAFSAPVNLGAINSDRDELDLALGPDGQDLIFSSSRDGTYQLYRAARGCDAAATASAERGTE